MTRGDLLGGLLGGLLAAGLIAGLLWRHCTSQPPVSPPEVREGLAVGWEAARDVAFARYPESFRVSGGRSDNRRRQVRLWEAGNKLRDGRHHPNTPQQVGDCVAWGLANAIRLRLELKGRLVEPFPPYLYGLARVTIGKNRPSCRSDGAVPAWAIDGLERHGFVTQPQAGHTYSGPVAREWGCQGPPVALLPVGERQRGAAQPIRTIDELIDALANGYPCTIASFFGTRTIRPQDGRQVARWDDRWAHQMCLIGYDGQLDPAYVYVLNSWGAAAHPVPLQGEPPGGFWVTTATAQRMVMEGECWAISDVDGFDVPADIDWSVFEGGRRSLTTGAPPAAAPPSRTSPTPTVTPAPTAARIGD